MPIPTTDAELLECATNFYLGRFWIHPQFTSGPVYLEVWQPDERVDWRVRAHNGGLSALFLLNEEGEPWRYKVGTLFPSREAALARFRRFVDAETPKEGELT